MIKNPRKPLNHSISMKKPEEIDKKDKKQRKHSISSKKSLEKSINSNDKSYLELYKKKRGISLSGRIYINKPFVYN